MSELPRDAFRRPGLKFSTNTDGPELLRTSLRGEHAWLLERGLLSPSEALACNRWAAEKSFVRTLSPGYRLRAWGATSSGRGAAVAPPWLSTRITGSPPTT